MPSKKTLLVGVLVGVVSLVIGFLIGAYYGGFLIGSISAVVTFLGGFGFGQVFDVVGLFREWYKGNREDKKEKHRAWKQRVLTIYTAYIDSLVSMKQPERMIDDYGWSDMPHRREAEAFLSGKSFYEEWRKCVQRWNNYIESLSKMRERRRTIESEFERKIIAELSMSGIPSGKQQKGNKTNENYADYEGLAYQVETCWRDGDEWSYTANALRQARRADNSDDKVLEKLVSLIENAKSGHLKQEYKEAVHTFEQDLWIQESRRTEEYNYLLKGKNDFLEKFKQLRDDIDAERVSHGVK
jgi:hypothetical protein